ncbi:hypothetical protein QEH56_12425 [Pelagicoccus enzymogenes]|uniref:hypothetical protein n=1 Tax=Pelagicoccus enzymogenes TaxID=2773457 RepID=UPI0028102045|nr:hypothetical protein [Pelagicoccus enzymogenes]MDQ8198963.1 hypothetical protein [Pelagicoccus enzymogenes]
MPFEIAYRPLLAAKIEHDYFRDLGNKEFESLPLDLQNRQRSKYQLSDYISILPTSETAALLQRHRCRIHPSSDQLLILASTTEENGKHRPERPLPDQATLYFTVHLRSTAFLSQANVPEIGQGQGLFFSNRFEHDSSSRLHLTQPLAVFDAAASYQAGDLVLDSANAPTQLFEAKTKLTPAANPDAAAWLRLPAPPYQNGASYKTGDRILRAGRCYEAKSDGQHPVPPDNAWTELYTPTLNEGVSAADRVNFRPSQFTVSLASAPTSTFATATLKHQSNAVAWEKSFFNPHGEALQTLAIDASGLAPDFYTLEVKLGDGSTLPGHPLSFFLLPASLATAPFALIEIQNRAAGSSHALVDAQGHLQSPTFYIRFRKRHAYWRYLFHGDTSDYPPSDTGPLVQEDPQDATRFVTTEPLPLTTAPFSLGSFDDSSITLPAPAAQVIREADRVVSQTFIHV